MHHPGTNNKVYKKTNDNFESVSYTHLRAHET